MWDLVTTLDHVEASQDDFGHMGGEIMWMCPAQGSVNIAYLGTGVPSLLLCHKALFLELTTRRPVYQKDQTGGDQSPRR